MIIFISILVLIYKNGLNQTKLFYELNKQKHKIRKKHQKIEFRVFFPFYICKGDSTTFVFLNHENIIIESIIKMNKTLYYSSINKSYINFLM